MVLGGLTPARESSSQGSSPDPCCISCRGLPWVRDKQTQYHLGASSATGLHVKSRSSIMHRSAASAQTQIQGTECLWTKWHEVYDSEGAVCSSVVEVCSRAAVVPL